LTILNRIRESRKRQPKNFREDYVENDEKGLPKTIYCKMTGATLQSTRKIGSKMMLAPTAAYAEIQIKFNDGSAHVTAISQDGIKALDDDALEAIYCADLLQWEREDSTISQRWIDRKITGYEVID
jgi:hypothetical protein